MNKITNRYTGEIMCGGLSLKLVLEKHLKWLCDKKDGESADLRGANLSGADLRGANLSSANLSSAYLRGADLRDADLRDANLSSAYLGGADLRDADLGGANLRDADLGGADLSDADLRGADLRGANLGGADLSDADLGGANLGGANLGGANLRGADLGGANLGGADFRSANLGGLPVKIKDIHKTIYAAASKDGALDMDSWHCGTTHCRAGWVIQLSGEAGKALEWAIGTPTAAALIYMASDPKLEKIPDFYATNEEALEDMKRLAECERKNDRHERDC